MDDCVIIGAGPAGLTAAHELAKLGRRAVVFEQDEVVGGLSRTVEYNGYRFDIGGHRFFTRVSYVQELWQELLGAELLTRPRLSRIFYDGKFFDYPLKPMAALRGLGPVEATRIVGSYVGSQLFPQRPEDNFEQWVSNRFGRRLFEIFFKTYTEKVWGLPCSEISADWAAQRIRDLDLVALFRDALLRKSGRKREPITTLIDRFQYPRHGPGQMWEACVKRLADAGIQTRLGARVDHVLHDSGRVRAILCSGRDGATRVEGRHFISSMPIRTLLRGMLPAPPAEVLAAADELRYRDFLTVGLIVDRAELFPDNWIYVHSPDVKLGRMQNYKNWSPQMVPDPDTTSLGVEYFVQEGDGLWTAEDGELIALATRECERLGLVPAGAVIDGTVIRMPKAYPVYDDGYLRSLATLRAWLRELPNLHLVGRNGQHRYNNQDHSMVTAIYTARNIAAGREEYDTWDVNVDDDYHEGADGDVRQSAGDRLVPQRVEEPQVAALIREAFARFDPVALGVAVGAVSGAGLFLATAVLLVRGGPDVGATLALLAHYLPSYAVNWLGALVGTLEVTLGGFGFGWVLAKLINGLIQLEERRILAEIDSRAAADLLERER